MIIARYNIEDLESKEVFLPWQKRGLSFTVSGFGRKIPTIYMVKLPGSNRWRRVYLCIQSNTGTCYVPDKNGNWIVIN